jgi:hypothetical protein
MVKGEHDAAIEELMLSSRCALREQIVCFVLSTFLRIVASTHGFGGEKIRFKVRSSRAVHLTADWVPEKNKKTVHNLFSYLASECRLLSRLVS